MKRPKKPARKVAPSRVLIGVLHEDDRFRDVGMTLVRATPAELKTIQNLLDQLRDRAGEQYEIQDADECSAKTYIRDLQTTIDDLFADQADARAEEGR